MKKIRKRSDVPSDLQWNLSDLYPSAEMWEHDFSTVTNLLPALKGFENRLTTASAIAECYRLLDRIGELSEKLYTYAHLRHHEDTSLAAHQGPVSRVERLMVDIREAASFVEPEILALTEPALREFAASPELAFYRFSMEKTLRRKPHTLPKEQEAIVARAGMLAQAPHSIFSMLNDADMRFGTVRDEQGNEVEVTHARYARLLESRDRRVRADAFGAICSAYRRQQNTIASLFQANIHKDLFYAKTLRYPSSLAMGLFDDQIPENVYENLIGTVRAQLPVFHRYLRLRKKVLGLPELHTYDLYAPLVPDFAWTIAYPEARDAVLDAVRPLGADYVGIARQAFDKRWVDVYENEGKHSGAYSWGVFGVHPYMLLNHEDSLDDAFTLAHELGHAVHSFLSGTHQKYHYASYSIFIAEIASTLNEALLLRHLLSTSADPARKAYLLTHFADTFRGTVIVQTLFAEFEHRVHAMAEEGKPLTLEALNALFFSLHEEYYGKEVTLDRDVEIGWMRIPHFYSSFYVYKYATGFSAAQFLSRRILDGAPGAVDRYLELLKSGGKDDPRQLLQAAGVDMRTPEPVRDAFQVLDASLAELERLLTA